MIMTLQPRGAQRPFSAGSAHLVPVDRPARQFDHVARAVFLAWARRLRGGELRLTDGGTERVFGAATEGGLRAAVRFDSPITYGDVALKGSVGLAHSYALGEWRADDLVAFLRLLIRNVDALDGFRNAISRAARPLALPLYHTRRSDIRRDWENVTAHYDLGNEFFRLFLDGTMTYSAGLFANDLITLEEASLAKLQKACESLQLRRTDHVLEVGSGWGSFAMHAAKEYGCHVTTITLSNEQFRYVSDIVKTAQMTDLINVVSGHYAGLEGVYDKLATIEMIEAVDWRDQRAFWQKCNSLLRPGGLMFLQSSVVQDRNYEREKVNRGFIKEVFPGGCFPSIGALTAAASRWGRLQLIRLDDVGADMAATTRCWRSNFDINRTRATELGVSQYFAQLWEFYLAYAEAGYTERYVSDIQAVFAKPNHIGGAAPSCNSSRTQDDRAGSHRDWPANSYFSPGLTAQLQTSQCGVDDKALCGNAEPARHGTPPRTSSRSLG